MLCRLTGEIRIGKELSAQTDQVNSAFPYDTVGILRFSDIAYAHHRYFNKFFNALRERDKVALLCEQCFSGTNETSGIIDDVNAGFF